MVSSIVPGATGAPAPGVDTRFGRAAQSPSDQRERVANSDRVELSSAAVSAARESVRDGIAQLQQALSLGREAMSMLVKTQEVARGEGSQDELDGALRDFSERLKAAVAGGARLVAGESIEVHAEPGSPPVTIEGLDLRREQEGGLMPSPAVAATSEAALQQAAQRSLDRLQEAMSRLSDSLHALEAHQGFLTAVDNVAGVRRDIDTDGARLLALQVRQGLERAGAPAIANTDPQSVLALFRA